MPHARRDLLKAAAFGAVSIAAPSIARSQTTRTTLRLGYLRMPAIDAQIWMGTRLDAFRNACVDLQTVEFATPADLLADLEGNAVSTAAGSTADLMLDHALRAPRDSWFRTCTSTPSSHRSVGAAFAQREARRQRDDRVDVERLRHVMLETGCQRAVAVGRLCESGQRDRRHRRARA